MSPPLKDNGPALFGPITLGPAGRIRLWHWMRCDEKDRLLEEYAARAREFCQAVEQLRKCSNEFDAFIRALDETGRVHRQVRTVAHSSG